MRPRRTLLYEDRDARRGDKAELDWCVRARGKIWSGRQAQHPDLLPKLGRWPSGEHAEEICMVVASLPD
jgi:hypothetical protein